MISEILEVDDSWGVNWSPPVNQRAAFAEGWITEAPGRSAWTEGLLNDEEVQSWVSRQGKFEATTPVEQQSQGGFRLLVFERAIFETDMSFSVSQDTFMRVMKEFNLPPVTSRIFQQDTGTNLPLLKLFRARPESVGNNCLSLSYNIASNFTTAILFGPGVFDRAQKKMKSSRIFQMLKFTRNLWSHPMILPLIVLADHWKTLSVVSHIVHNGEMIVIEKTLGVTKLGRHWEQSTSLHELGTPKKRALMSSVTESLNTLLTRIILYSSSHEWEVETVTWLQDLLISSKSLIPRISNKEWLEIEDFVRYCHFSMRNLSMVDRELRERANCQLNILYSLVAQTDNELSARISVSAGRDSVAMKSLAVITAIFLPGTTIASLFSMGMFNWQANVNADGRVVSPNFWIYWVVAVPLTATVILVRRIWWKYQDRAYQRELGNVTKPARNEHESV